MELIVGLLIAGAGGLLLARWQRGKRSRSWRKAAGAAGLSEVEVSQSALTGRAGALQVRLEECRAEGTHGTRIVVGGLGHRPRDLAFRSEAVATAAVRRALGGEIEIGDAAFDEAVSLQGSPELACALLDVETRGRVLRLMEGFFESSVLLVERAEPRVVLADGELSVELPEKGGWYRAGEALPAVLGLAERLRAPDDIPAQLARNAGSDPKPGVRRRNLLALTETYPTHEKTGEALHAALADPDTEVRLRAAVAVGAEGWDVLQELASNEQTTDEHAARAVQELGDHLTVDQAKELFAEARRRRRTATAQACLLSLGPRGDPEAVETLAQALTVTEDGVAAVAARALGATRSPAAEALLIDVLASRPLEVMVAAAEALGRMGTAAAVAPLREAAERHRGADLRRAVRQAVGEIQARLTGAAPGQLSLAGDGTGHLSLTEHEARGHVSLPDEPEIR